MLIEDSLGEGGSTEEFPIKGACCLCHQKDWASSFWLAKNLLTLWVVHDLFSKSPSLINASLLHHWMGEPFSVTLQACRAHRWASGGGEPCQCASWGINEAREARRVWSLGFICQWRSCRCVEFGLLTNLATRAVSRSLCSLTPTDPIWWIIRVDNSFFFFLLRMVAAH